MSEDRCQEEALELCNMIQLMTDSSWHRTVGCAGREEAATPIPR